MDPDEEWECVDKISVELSHDEDCPVRRVRFANKSHGQLEQELHAKVRGMMGQAMQQYTFRQPFVLPQMMKPKKGSWLHPIGRRGQKAQGF